MAVFDSFANGIQAGQALRASHEARADRKRKDQARKQLGQFLWSDDPSAMAQPPMPGQPSVPKSPEMMGAGGAPQMPTPQPPQMAQPQVPQSVPLPGATPMPQPPAPMPMPAPRPQGPMQMGPNGQPMPGPAEPGGPPQGGGNPADANPFMDSLHTLRQVAQSIKAANPTITPEQLMDATSEALDSMKGVSAETLQWSKALLGADTSANTQASRERIAGGHDTSRENVANIRADAMRDVSQNTVDWHKYQSDMMYKRAVEAATIAANSRRDVASTAAGSRENVANITADSRRDVANTNADSRDYGSEVGYEGRVDSAAARTTGVIPGAASGSTKRPFKGRTRTAPVNPTDPYAAYHTPADVAAAFKAGKLSEAEARRALGTKFGIH